MRRGTRSMAASALVLSSALLLLAVVVIEISCTPPSDRHRESRNGAKVKRESDDALDSVENDADEVEDGGDLVVYDQQQINGDTNIRLRIKNFQLQLPESQLERFQQSDMAQIIRQSVLRLFGLPYDVSKPSDPPSPQQSFEQQQQKKQQQQEQQHHQLQSANSMLQVNGNNLPAKFFLEISDFLMNTNDNDAVDDKRIESNHHQQAQVYATEEIKIERLENTNNVKNETITISKKRQNVATVPPNGTLYETESTAHRITTNTTHNQTESEDRFEQSKPIRVDTVLMQIEADDHGKPKTFREKVIWRLDEDSHRTPDDE